MRKTDTSTKLHIIPARPKSRTISDLNSKPTLDQRRRAPLNRAHTSGQHPTLSSFDADTRDSLLITRLFNVTLEDGAKVVVKPSSTGEINQEKPPKLVENKLPQYAVGLVLQLPHPTQRPRSSSVRFGQNSSYGQSFNSAASSFGSDMQSSWTFLDAIPASLSSSLNISEEDDHRLDLIVDNWDVILRAIACFERTAADVLKDQLQKVLGQLMEPQFKIPKEKSMQRTNQRMVAIHDVEIFLRYPSLVSAAADVSRRIAYAVRIPRVVTGLGITAGHWTDEARMLYRTCGNKQQNFFLFNLLTAFLGNHMQWLERLAPEWYRNQFRATHSKPEELCVLASRTIIVSEHKGLARRLIYILASFLPGRKGITGLHRSVDEGQLALSLSPSGAFSRHQSLRRSSKPYLLHPQSSTELGAETVSSSISSQGSHASTLANRSPRKSLSRKYSNTIQIKGNRIESDVRTGAGTTSTIMPNAMQTPTAYISSLRENYSPENAIIESNDSIATADLSKVLHRAASSHRRTSSVSSRWGSLVSGISEMWSNKQSTPGDRGSFTTASLEGSPARQKRSSAVSTGRNNPLQMMIDELEHGKSAKKTDSVEVSDQGAFSPNSQSTRVAAAQPRLHVDGRDGVVDVELDLPGFLSASTVPSPPQTSSTSRKKSLPFTHDGTDSICSFRSLNAHVDHGLANKRVNVGGYLRRHHEDFVLHAVRPYNDLLEDVKRNMRLEPTPREKIEHILQRASPSAWVCVCTTLIADTKQFTIRRLTLRRHYEVKTPLAAGSRGGTFTGSSPGTTISFREEEITDEVVMEFDTTLADAIEKVLQVGPTDASLSPLPTRTHSRNVSISSKKTAPPPIPSTSERPGASSGRDLDRSEQRDLVIGALEDVVKSVNDDLNRPGQQRQNIHNEDKSGQENALREGVKRWMINVEQTSVW